MATPTEILSKSYAHLLREIPNYMRDVELSVIIRVANTPSKDIAKELAEADGKDWSKLSESERREYLRKGEEQHHAASLAKKACEQAERLSQKY